MILMAPRSDAPADFDREITIVACVKSLVDALKREKGRISGADPGWLADPSVTFLRAELYARDGVKGWTYADDSQAAQRLLIWLNKVRRAA